MALENTYAEVLSTSVVKGFYDEVNDDYAKALNSLLPPGAAWTFEDDSEMYKFLRALSYPFLRVAQRAQRIFEEMDPRTTTELLDDWERVLDLPGTNPDPASTTAERRNAIHTLLLGHGDPNESFWVETALGGGYNIKVLHKEYQPFVPGSVAGDPLTNEEWPFYWKIIAITSDTDDALEWYLDKLIPAHTNVAYGFIGSDFTERSNAKNITLRGVAADGFGRWVAVGYSDGTDGYVLVSQNGYIWSESSNPQNTHLYCVAYYDNLFVAAGNDIGGDTYVITSADGVSWTERVAPAALSIYGMAHNGSDLWCGVGEDTGGGSRAYIMTSPDGTTWTQRTGGGKNFDLYGIAHDQSGYWVAVGEADGTDAYIVNSTDGITWGEQSNPKNFSLRSVAYDGASRWVAVGDADGTDAYIVTSDDNGVTWAEQSNPKNFGLRSVVFVEVGLESAWFAFGAADGTDAYAVMSEDGETWVEITNTKNFVLFSAAYDRGLLVTVGGADGTDAYIATSGPASAPPYGD